jgi:hypothetical protein
MKLIDVFLIIFILAVVVVLIAIITVNIDLFMWATIVADTFGIFAFILNFFFNKELSK